MFKVVICDDERIIREGLKQIIPWGDYHFNTIYTAKDIEACQKQTQQLAEYIEGSDWEGQFANKVKDVLLIMAKFQEELVQPMADHQKAIDNLSQNLAKYDTLSIKQGLDRVNP
ncbi:virulence factor [Staphylococcus aureus]|nr:virulence factor [Staphylococcus aureus]